VTGLQALSKRDNPSPRLSSYIISSLIPSYVALCEVTLLVTHILDSTSTSTAFSAATLIVEANLTGTSTFRKPHDRGDAGIVDFHTTLGASLPIHQRTLHPPP